jgi:SAM-dependent methyltransferase
MLRGALYHDRYRQLNLLYRITNPWGLDSPRETFRFEETNRLIQREFGKVATLLEVGCGEGYQSQYLAKICDRLHGCDISARAVDRARRRVQTATFSIGTLRDIFASGARYELVVACEVLYYVKNIPMAVQAMSDLGASCLVTYYQGYQEQLDQKVIPPKSAGRSLIRYGDCAWKAVWWHNK